MPQIVPEKQAEEMDLLREARQVVPDADSWLNTENTLFRCRKPIDLIGTEDERQLRDAIGLSMRCASRRP